MFTQLLHRPYIMSTIHHVILSHQERISHSLVHLTLSVPLLHTGMDGFLMKVCTYSTCIRWCTYTTRTSPHRHLHLDPSTYQSLATQFCFLPIRSRHPLQ